MKLYLLRHAHSPAGYPDEQRPLSPEGREDVAALGRFLRDRELIKNPPWEVRHSPLLRAVETATILHKTMGLEAPLTVDNTLKPEDDAEATAERMKSFASANRDLILVGHNPHMSLLTSALLTGSEYGCLVDFKKCAMAKFSLYTSKWVLEWMVTPKMFRG